MINLIRAPPKNPEWKIEPRASICADTVCTQYLLLSLFTYLLEHRMRPASDAQGSDVGALQVQVEVQVLNADDPLC